MKVALCLFGEMRTFDHPRLRELFLKNIVEPLQPDIFISTWKKRGISEYSKNAGINYGSPDQCFEAFTLIDFYNAKHCIVDDYDRWEKSLSPEYSKALHSSKGTSVPQFYKMHSVVHMKSVYEGMSGVKYDIVILMRPDLIVFKPISPLYLTNSDCLWTMNCLTAYWPQRIYGMLEISSSENIDYLAEAFMQIPELSKQPITNGLDAHDACRLLHIHYTKHSSNVRSYLDRKLFEVLRQDKDFDNDKLPEVQEASDKQLEIKRKALSGERISYDGYVKWLLENRYIVPTDEAEHYRWVDDI